MVGADMVVNVLPRMSCVVSLFQSYSWLLSSTRLPTIDQTGAEDVPVFRKAISSLRAIVWPAVVLKVVLSGIMHHLSKLLSYRIDRDTAQSSTPSA